MKALVTGGTGFLGTHLIELLLAKGYSVRCLAKDRLHANCFPKNSVEIMIGDVSQTLEWEPIFGGVSHVFHLAGLTRASSKQEYVRGNYGATRHFLEVSRKYGRALKKFVYASSLAVTGPSESGEPVDEATPCRPVSAYGWSKFLAEREVFRYGEELPFVILRPSSIYGPRERDFLSFMKLVKHGVHVLIGGRETVMSLVHVRDVVKGMVLAAENDNSTGQVYCLGSKRAFSTGEIARSLAQIMGVRVPVRIRVPLSVTYAAACVSQTVGWLLNKPPFLNLERVKEVMRSPWICSIAKAQEQLGYVPEIGLREGLASTYEWYVQHGLL